MKNVDVWILTIVIFELLLLKINCYIWFMILCGLYIVFYSFKKCSKKRKNILITFLYFGETSLNIIKNIKTII